MSTALKSLLLLSFFVPFQSCPSSPEDKSVPTTKSSTIAPMVNSSTNPDLPNSSKKTQTLKPPTEAPVPTVTTAKVPPFRINSLLSFSCRDDTKALKSFQVCSSLSDLLSTTKDYLSD